MGYRANERGKLSEDFVAAGDGLGAFGAALILPVQMHCNTGRATAAQWICTNRSHGQRPRLTDKQGQQIPAKLTSARAAARANMGHHPLPLSAAGRHATAADRSRIGCCTTAMC